jgi:hypothetical protein
MAHKSTSSTTSYIIIVLLSIGIAMGGYALYEYHEQHKNKEAYTAPKTLIKETSKKIEATTTKNIGNSLYAGITDVPFVTFATTVIDKRCPFYIPDGTTYRECLTDWVDELSKKLLVEQVDEVHAYCEMFSAKYADAISFESSELFTKCSIYKLQP